MKPKNHFRALLLSASCIVAQSSFAANVWDGGGSDANWTTANNWDNNVVPTTATLTFRGILQTTTNNDRTAASTVGGINFTNNGTTNFTNAFTLSGNSITLNGNITTTANTAGSTITDVISFDIILNNNRTITTNQQSASVQHNLTISGSISETGGTRGIIKAGDGVLTLDGANSYNGTTTITAGDLIISGSHSGNGALIMNSSGNLIISGTYSGSGDVNLNAGNLTLSGTHSGGGNLNLNAGTFDLGGGAGTGTLASTVLNLNGGSFSFTRNDSATHSFTTTNINSAGSSISAVSGNILNLGTVVRAIGATLDFSTTGAGTVAADGASNDASGIMAGFTFGDTWAVADGANVAISGLANGSFTLTSTAGASSANYSGFNIDVDNSPGALDAGITANSLRFSAAGVNTLSLTGTNILTSGGILVGSGVGNNLSSILGGTLSGAASKDLSIIQNNTSNGLAIASDIVNNGGATALTKSGVGLLTLAGNNTFTGGVFINAGELVLDNTGALNSTAGSENAVTFGSGSAGKLSLAGNSVTIKSLTDATGLSTVQNASVTAATLTIGNSTNQSSTYGGTIQDGAGGGALSLIKAGNGTLTLSGSNNYSGGTTLNGGTLIVDSNAALGSASTSITVSGNSALTSAAAAATNVDYTRAISLGGNTLTLANNTTNTTASFSGAITGSGGITVSAGSGTNTVALSNAGNTFTGDLTLIPGGNSNLFVSFASIGDAGVISLGRSGWRRIVQYTGDSNLVLNTRRIDIGSSFGGVYDGGGNPSNMFENNGAGTITFNADMTVADNRTGTFFFGGTNAGNNIFAGVIPNSTGGILSIAKFGAGKWIFTNDNTYTGNTILAGGILSVAKIANTGDAQPLGQGSIIQLGDRGGSGNLEFTGSTNTITDKQIQLGGTHTGLTGAGGIINNGTGTLSFNNATFNSPDAGANVTRILTLGGSNTGANTISGIIQNNNASNGRLALTKIDGGTWVLDGVNSYTGNTSVNGGTLRVSGSLSSTSALLMGGGTFEMNSSASSQTMASLALTATTASNIVVGAGKTLAITSGTFSVSNWSAVNFDLSASGSVMTLPVASKDVYLGSTTALATILDSTGFGFAAVNPSNQIYRLNSTLLSESGGSSSTIYRVDNNLSDPGSGAGTGDGGNNLTITATQTVGSLAVDTTARSGVMTLGSGVTLKSNEFAFGSSGNTSNTYTITGGTGIGQAAGNNNMNISNYGGTVTFETPLLATGSGYINFNGTGTTVLTGTNLYGGSQTGNNGSTRIYGSGILQIAGTGSLNSGNYAPNISINGSSTLQYSSSTDQTLGGIISGTGALIKDTSASSTLTLTGANTYTGATTVNAGTLLVNGNISSSNLTTVASGATIGGSGTIGALTVSSGGFINPGNSPDILTVVGDYIQAGGYTAEITGLTAGITGHDQIDVTGAVDITGGSLTALFSAGSYTANDLIFVLLNDGTDAITGIFTGLADGATVTNHGGYDWNISYFANSDTGLSTGGNDIALLAVAPIPEPRAALLGCLSVLLLLRRRR